MTCRVQNVLYPLLLTALVLVIFSDIVCGKYSKFMYVQLACSSMLLAVFPNSLISFVSHLHFLKASFLILHTVTMGRFLQNGDRVLIFPLFNILNDLKVTKLV